MTITFYVRANLYDYECGSSQLSRSFTTIEQARAFRDKVTAHLALTQAEPAGVSIRFVQQEEGETDEAFEARERAWQVVADQHHEEQLDWFPGGSGYFTSQPVIVQRTWEETVVT